jgi:hypothetical protein
MMSGNTADEMVANGTAHVMQAHPDIAESMKTMSPEAMAEWRADFQKKWDAAPEMQATA